MKMEKPLAEMPYKEYRLRLEKARELMDEHHIDALLTFSPTNIRYYTGFAKASTATSPRWRKSLIIPKDSDPVLVGFGLTPATVTTWVKDLRELEAPNVEDSTPYVDLFVDTIKDLKLDNGTLGVDIDPWWPGIWALDVSPRDIESMKRKLSNAKFVEAFELPRTQRVVKTDFEIEIFRKCCDITAEAFMKAFAEAREGMTELEIAQILWQTFIKKGGLVTDGVLVGRMNADFYGRALSPPLNRKLTRGDYIGYNGGGCYRGYNSDMARLISVGEPSEQQKKLYEAARIGTDAAYDAFKPGNNTAEVYNSAIRAAKKVYPTLTAARHCGHGIGMDSHEPPFLSPDVNFILKPGMVIAVEVPLNDHAHKIRGGTMENDLVVTEDGYENLTGKMPIDLLVI